MSYFIKIKNEGSEEHYDLWEFTQQGLREVQKDLEVFHEPVPLRHSIEWFIGERATQDMVRQWKEKGSPEIDLGDGTVIDDLEAYVHQPANYLAQAAVNFVLRRGPWKED